MSVGLIHLPASSRNKMCVLDPSYALFVVFFQLMMVSSASPLLDVLFAFVMRLAGSLKANSTRGFVVPSWIGLKKNGYDLKMGITFDINTASCASVPVLLIIPNSLSFTRVPSSAMMLLAIFVYPERRHFTYTCPILRGSTLHAS